MGENCSTEIPILDNFSVCQTFNSSLFCNSQFTLGIFSWPLQFGIILEFVGVKELCV